MGLAGTSYRWEWSDSFSKILGTLKNRFAFNLYNSGLASYVVGMILKGILEISGTTSNYLFLYTAVGTVLLGISLFLFIGNRLMNTEF